MGMPLVDDGCVSWGKLKSEIEEMKWWRLWRSSALQCGGCGVENFLRVNECARCSVLGHVILAIVDCVRPGSSCPWDLKTGMLAACPPSGNLPSKGESQSRYVCLWVGNLCRWAAREIGNETWSITRHITYIMLILTLKAIVMAFHSGNLRRCVWCIIIHLMYKSDKNLSEKYQPNLHSSPSCCKSKLAMQISSKMSAWLSVEYVKSLWLLFSFFFFHVIKLQMAYVSNKDYSFHVFVVTVWWVWLKGMQ